MILIFGTSSTFELVFDRVARSDYDRYVVIEDSDGRLQHPYCLRDSEELSIASFVGV